MDKFTIEVTNDGARYQFEVRDYVHEEEHNRCKFEIFSEDKFLASFEPDSRGFLHICRNPGDIDEPVLHLIADKLETYNP